jgi:hypothetical protein
MFIENLPGVKTSFSFKNKYSSKNLLDMQEIFDRPNRKKLGYFWGGINSFNTKQTVKYKEGPFFFSGFSAGFSATGATAATGVGHHSPSR